MLGMSQPGLEPAFLFSCANLQGFAFAASTSMLSHLEKSCHVNSLSEHCFHISPARGCSIPSALLLFFFLPVGLVQREPAG